MKNLSNQQSGFCWNELGEYNYKKSELQGIMKVEELEQGGDSGLATG